ncbi:MAG: hypothetical protein N2234_07610 [Planctomycetota bacterium]|nr:hypothetical protein [Planctomycetota bacterium]
MRVIFLFLLFCAVGCVQKYYGAPTSLLSAEKQSVFTRAVEHAVEKLSFDSIKSSKVFIHFNPPARENGDEMTFQQTQALQASVPAGGFLLPVSGGGSVTVRSQLPQEEDYIAERLRERLVSVGVKLTEKPEEADFVVYTLLFSSGTETTMREVSYQNIPFFYSEEVEHILHLLILAYDRKNKRIVRLLDGKALAKDMEVFLLKLYGPKLKSIKEEIE